MHTFSEEEELPEYITKYGEEIKYAGYPEFVSVAREHKKAVQDYDEVTYPRQMSNLKMTDPQFEERAPKIRETAINSINQQYQQKALDVAKKHGFVEEKQTGKSAQSETGNQQQPANQSGLTSSQIKRQKFLEEMKIVSEKNRQQEQGYNKD